MVRDWPPSDAHALARHADSRAVWRNLRDAFPGFGSGGLKAGSAAR